MASEKTTVYLTEQDRADAAYIQEENGLRNRSSVIRMAIRRVARQLRERAAQQQRPADLEAES